MVETVLGLPFLLLVLLIVFFLGRQWMRQQHAEDTVFFDTWQYAERSDWSASPSADYEEYFLRSDPELSIETVNTFPSVLSGTIADAVTGVDAEAGLFVEVVENEMPSGVLREHEAAYPANGIQNTLMRWFPGNTGYARNLKAFHLRLDQPWPHVLNEGYEHPTEGSTDTVSHHDLIRDEYMTDLADALEGLTGNGIADATHNTLGRISHYRGPAFPGE